MSDSLTTYLHDHLAGSHFAVELLETLCERSGEDPLVAFTAALLSDIKEDQEVLQKIVDRVGKGHIDLKAASAWFAEKASQLKLQHDEPGGLGTFEALETLMLGITGKLALWRVLPVIAEFDPRVGAQDFARLAVRAQDQWERVEEQRMRLARVAFEKHSK